MSQERRLQVLRAIVEDYVVTEEPVGSKQLVERHQMDVSPATIRNDMAALEDEGYIVAPHTSAGRIPTDKGYRLFVDSLAEVKPLTTAERRAIQSFLDQAVDLDDVMSRTVRLLAQLTHQVALAQYPRLAISSVRHVELVDLGQRRVLLVVIADTGRVEQRVVAVPEDVSEADLQAMRTALNAAVAGKRFSQVASEVQPLAQMFTGSARAALSAVLANLLEAVVAPTEDRVVLAGTANLARSRRDFEATLEPVLEALEEQMVLLRLLGQADDVEAAHVRIGSENDVESLARTSVITSGYGSASEVVATIGVLGPTRMDYSTSISAVQAVARYVGRLIGE